MAMTTTMMTTVMVVVVVVMMTMQFCGANNIAVCDSNKCSSLIRNQRLNDETGISKRTICL
jgi:hypothetical protein